jgi:murein peptide amidase A
MTWTPRLAVIGAAVVGAAALAAVSAFGSGSVGTAKRPDPVGSRSILLGRSVDGRAIAAVETGDFDSPNRTLVVGCIHGNECAGIAILTRLAHTAPPSEADVWIVLDLNPDGASAGTRGNAHGVDLNRNFPWRWTRLGGVYYSGAAPLSEPETRVAYRLIERVRPSVSIWFHQHLDVVDDSTGSLSIERRFANVAGLRLASLTQEPGSVVTWESHCFPHASPFVVELPAGALTRAAVSRLARAVWVTAATAPEAGPAAAECSTAR